jgi:hypothetical protein
VTMGDSKSDALHPPSYDRGVADERARCMKVLEDLRDSSRHSGAEWIAYRFAITALSEAATPVPVASSPVGGEQP